MTTDFLLASPKLATVSELVQCAKRGDSDAFGELVSRFESAVFATAMRRLGNAVEAEEIVQEVFVKAFEKLHQLQEPDAIGGWLRAIAARLVINRKQRRGPVSPADPETIDAVCSEANTPLDEALAAERRAQLRAGLDRLGRLDRETLCAFYFRGQSLVEMSDEFRSPVGTIKRRLHVARQRLAKELGGMHEFDESEEVEELAV